MRAAYVTQCSGTEVVVLPPHSLVAVHVDGELGGLTSRFADGSVRVSERNTIKLAEFCMLQALNSCRPAGDLFSLDIIGDAAARIGHAVGACRGLRVCIDATSEDVLLAQVLCVNILDDLAPAEDELVLHRRCQRYDVSVKIRCDGVRVGQLDWSVVIEGVSELENARGSADRINQ